MAEPGNVSAEPLADAGKSGCSSEADSWSVRPTAFASPQSITSVSPCLPTMTLPGLISRCSTPRRVRVVNRVADVGEAT